MAEDNIDYSDDMTPYDEVSREETVDAGGMTPEEDAFMKGYEEHEDEEEDEIE